MNIALIVHGGAGNWRPGADSAALASTTEAVAAGRRILEEGGNALDAACAAAVVLEDNPIFNAGTGSVLNLDGFVEMDACVMLSKTNQIGSVTGLQRVKNPILVARQVMEETDHVMLSGDGAQRFARTMGHADYDPVTPDRQTDWKRKKKEFDKKSSGLSLKVRRFLQAHPEYAGGTIGVVAMDRHGVLCAATSTGGMTLKLPGRIGDTPLPGCGTYASRYAAASATGTGEFIIRVMACRQIVDNISKGMSLQRATDSTLDQLSREFNADAGIIAIDAHGVPYANHLSADMPHAWFCGNSDIVARMRVPK